MYTADLILGQNMNILTQVNSTLKEQDKCLQDENTKHTKFKGELALSSNFWVKDKKSTLV